MPARTPGPRPALARLVAVAAAAGVAACTSSTSPVDDPPRDTLMPFAIDMGGADAEAPVSYKGLPLALHAPATDPQVAPIDGRIGVVCVGMSNANQECDALIARLLTEWQDEVAPAVVVVNCARGGHAIERWIDPAYDDALWIPCRTKLDEAGLTAGQVQVVLHKAANQFTRADDGSTLPPYPAATSDYFAFGDNLSRFAARVAEELPGVRAVYTTSRSYGGYADRADRGEPLSYEEGHALNAWLAANEFVDGVWHGWGPYIWAPACGDGLNGSGICYERDDYVADGVHPSSLGRAKIAGLWHQRLLDEEWYRR